MGCSVARHGKNQKAVVLHSTVLNGVFHEQLQRRPANTVKLVCALCVYTVRSRTDCLGDTCTESKSCDLNAEYSDDIGMI